MTILELIRAENYAEGPFPTSGGTVHKVTSDTAQAVADAVAAAAGSWCVPVVLICAYLRGESNFDPDAINPNRELAPGGAWPTPAEEAAHTDYGLCQVNGNGSYLGIGAIKESLDYLCAEIITNVMWAVVNKFPPEVGYEAYNTGRTGAQTLYEKGGVPACNYGRLIAARVEQYVNQKVI